ncbi:MAG: iron-sulfur cluster assembly scaffold protein [Candidatus Rehaiarchaeum fermentans]|nr:iron-sulfur cluster assembly scaffold protein [Candidatus Rehaiarchaeum fermentans]MCW1293685.1 iron-sulfur cluster assembly scaffold protein [Candidatus Rehaiarchaeum fermentans]MCW1302174.1 iron-sulfur cluster assembly scaffold protein [Candidatus Rehaiarchaeum fermentans]MCW1311506.1 iron-sulfur cluster assembly scaffold protein [Candidatus Rehaiarchaeum fermentans]
MTDYFQLLEEYRNPKNRGTIENADIVIEGYSTSCGDKFSFYIKTENGKIIDAKFDGSGCAISTVSSSRFCNYIIGKDLKELEENLPDEKKMCELLEIEEIGSSRIGCLMLPVNALKSLKNKANKS